MNRPQVRAIPLHWSGKMQERCQAEVVDLHRFFVQWFTGAVPRSEEVYARFAGVMAEGFALISPRGVIIERLELLREVEAAHGMHASDDDGFAIEIREFRPRYEAAGLWLVTYEEWQRRAGELTGRLSSAWLRAKDGTPHGVEWLHVHETWLPARTEPRSDSSG